MSGQQENYGKSDPGCVAKVKDLYKELNLEVCPGHHIHIIYNGVNHIKITNSSIRHEQQHFVITIYK
jgi:hypothetical protein